MRGSAPFSSAMSTGRVLAAVAVVCACAGSAQAQTPRVQGPFAGLFGGNAESRTTSQSLDVRGSLFGVYQEVLKPSADLLRELDPRFQKTGTFGGASAGASYSYQRSTRSSGFFAGATATASDYSVAPESILASYSGTTGVRAQLTRKLSFGASGSAGYSPFYNFGAESRAQISNPLAVPSVYSSPAIAGGLDQTLPGSEFGISAAYAPNLNLGGGANLTANLTQRASLDFRGDYRTVRLSDTSDSGYDTWSGGADFRYSLTRQLTLHLGYRRDISWLGGVDAPRYSRDGYEAGLDYGDSLTFKLGRRSTLSLAPSASVVRWNGRTHFRANGSALLTHNLGRSWTASEQYVRDVNFVLGFAEPVLSDTASASLGGTLLPKVRWSNSVGWSRGKVGFDDGGHYTSYFGLSSLSVALASRLALFGQYTCSVYSLPPGLATLTLPSEFARQSVSVGLTVYAPVFSTGRGRR